MEKIHLTSDKDAIVIREGKAPEIRQPKGVEYIGNISAPADWLLKKIEVGKPIQPENVTITYDQQAGKITAIIDEFIPEQACEITGRLKQNGELNKFDINGTGRWNHLELKKFLKRSRQHFEDKDAHRVLIANLDKFKIKFIGEIQNSNDNRGNKKMTFEQSVKSEIDFSFLLNMPIFKDGESVSFRVDICFDISDSSPEFWLESTELIELRHNIRSHIISAELDRLADFVIISV